MNFWLLFNTFFIIREQQVVMNSLLFISDRYESHYSCEDGKKYLEYIIINVLNASRKYNVRYTLVLAVIDVESNFKYDAISSKKAVGLMQLMYSTAKIYKDDVTIEDLYNIEVNIDIGTRHLAYLVNKYGEVEGVGRYYAGKYHLKYPEYYEKVKSIEESIVKALSVDYIYTMI